MSSVTIRGIPVKFPFSPYDIQKDYMTKVIDCIDTPANGVLESPTGTGKTLSLLCASLAWLERKKKEVQDQQTQLFKDTNGESKDASAILMTVPKIIYASRTHTQLWQAMQEMKRTEYSHMRACILGSREQLCFDQEVIGEKNAGLKMKMCRSKVKKNQCSYFNNIKKEKNNESLSNKAIVDIEDIVKLGRTHDFCPYYMALELKNEADVVFMPYNYLLDPNLSKYMGDVFFKNIVIFDQAHHIENDCKDYVSVEIKTEDIQSAIDDVRAVLNLITNGTVIDVDEEKLKMLISVLIDFKKQIDETPLGADFDGDHIFTILENSKITAENQNDIIELLETIMDFICSTGDFQRSGYGLQVLGSLLNIVFYKNSDEFRKKIRECFKVQINSEPEDCRVLNFWCFCAEFGMGLLMERNVRCVILTSGILAPLEPLISRLQLDVPVRMENPHIVTGDQVCVKILSQGPDEELLNSTLWNRENTNYFQSLGLAILDLIKVIPGGVLIFFPSYEFMEKTKEYWRKSGVWDNINRIKPVYTEPRDETSFSSVMGDYYSKIQDPNYKRAIFMGVCQGKISEGLDFTDINGRAVFIVGVPYPKYSDPKVMLKKRYLDFRNTQDREYLDFDEWYSLQASRAVNQAIGRVIRHKNDYGAIILLDERFGSNYSGVDQLDAKSNLSPWLREHITNITNFQETVTSVKTFFQSAIERFPAEVKSENDNSVKIHARKAEYLEGPSKR